MDLLIEAVKWVVIIGLIFYIVEKMPIGPPIQRAMTSLLLFLWRRTRGTNAPIPPELAEKMNEVEKRQILAERQRRRQHR